MLPLPSNDLWRDESFRRLWLSVLISSFVNQITTMALSLTSAISLNASASQIGILGAVGISPYVLFSLPAGVWLDRVRKLPIYIAGELIMAATLSSVALVWYFGQLSMAYLYIVAFVSGCVSIISGTAAQIVLTQIVPRKRLVEAHSRNGLATSSAEIAGPSVAGAMIKLVGAPLALLFNSAFLIVSILLLRGIRAEDAPLRHGKTHFWRDLWEGVRFVLGDRMLMPLALAVGGWQICQTTAMVVQVLFGIRELGLNEYQYGLCFSLAGIGTVLTSLVSHRISHRIGPGPAFILGIAISGIGWLQEMLIPLNAWSVVSFQFMLLCYSSATVLLFTNVLAMRQSVTPPHMLARMTSTMRFMSLLPASIGSVFGGFLGEQMGLRSAMALGALGALLLALFLWRFTVVSKMLAIPESDERAHHV